MTTIRKSIELDVPAQVAYEQLQDLGSYRRLVADLRPQAEDSDLDIEITETRKNERINWHSNGRKGAEVDGQVRLEPMDGTHTRIELTMEYKQVFVPGAPEPSQREIDKRLQKDLELLKKRLERSATANS
ncbi:hypothetical protein GCM10012275_04990 [Longimycelium tulufanense]|uniref:Polyketide cyclase / dehydrase and lipid transport n=1 Tax=Longimycelium tulufanense TaxID=907463 RepID=A0A8J3C682_9PSEU|nr:hypothetical protein [Longimycelium tulufanense]GGM36834.1 hypothetical protein GCM10012275_04990 [Longimycelium tulufanense]